MTINIRDIQRGVLDYNHRIVLNHVPTFIDDSETDYWLARSISVSRFNTGAGQHFGTMSQLVHYTYERHWDFIKKEYEDITDVFCKRIGVYDLHFMPIKYLCKYVNCQSMWLPSEYHNNILPVVTTNHSSPVSLALMHTRIEDLIRGGQTGNMVDLHKVPGKRFCDKICCVAWHPLNIKEYPLDSYDFARLVNDIDSFLGRKKLAYLTLRDKVELERIGADLSSEYVCGEYHQLYGFDGIVKDDITGIAIERLTGGQFGAKYLDKILSM